jgi:hypothetical protein
MHRAILEIAEGQYDQQKYIIDAMHLVPFDLWHFLALSKYTSTIVKWLKLQHSVVVATTCSFKTDSTRHGFLSPHQLKG